MSDETIIRLRGWQSADPVELDLSSETGGPHTHAQYVETSDPRLSDARQPVEHDHPSEELPEHAHPEYADGDDPRLSDARQPTAHDHEHDHASAIADAIGAHEQTQPHGEGGEAGPHTHAQYIETTDDRLSDSREALPHEHPHDHEEYAALEHAHEHEHEHEGYATDDALAAHAALPHGGEAGPHDHDEYATDAELAAAIDGLASIAQLDAHAATTHGGGGGIEQQPAIDDVIRSGNANTQTSNLQNKVDEILATMRAAGIIAT